MNWGHLRAMLSRRPSTGGLKIAAPDIEKTAGNLSAQCRRKIADGCK